jgi:hypothetical protein
LVYLSIFIAAKIHGLLNSNFGDGSTKTNNE